MPLWPPILFFPLNDNFGFLYVFREVSGGIMLTFFPVFVWPQKNCGRIRLWFSCHRWCCHLGTPHFCEITLVVVDKLLWNFDRILPTTNGRYLFNLVCGLYDFRKRGQKGYLLLIIQFLLCSSFNSGKQMNPADFICFGSFQVIGVSVQKPKKIQLFIFGPILKFVCYWIPHNSPCLCFSIRFQISLAVFKL